MTKKPKKKRATTAQMKQARKSYEKLHGVEKPLTYDQQRAIKVWQKLFEGDQMNARSALTRCEMETGDGAYAVARDLLEAFER